MVEKEKNQKKQQLFAIAGLLVAGVVSIYFFFLITGLPIFQGATEEFLLGVATFSWVLIFPLWVVIFMLIMMAADYFWPNWRRHK